MYIGVGPLFAPASPRARATTTNRLFGREARGPGRRLGVGKILAVIYAFCTLSR